MKKTFVVFALIAICASALCEEKIIEKPKIEVVFVLDTTGSMSGLIAGAKAKIWYIAEQIVRGKPTPEVKMGIVAYRDKGDAYVTKVFDITDNIDQVYSDLNELKAEGGGDTPENVNLALYEAINKIKWSSDTKALRIIYLVGDSPPHNDYEDVQGYKKTAEEAIKKGVYINTILCGGNQETKKIWTEISDAAEGTFVAIEQGGGVREIPTPYDDELAKLNRELVGTAIVYGSRTEKAEGRKSKETAGRYSGGAGASRAYYAVKAEKPASIEKDLVKDADNSEVLAVKLESLKEEELPDEMRKMTEEERIKYVEEMKAKREKIVNRIKELSAKRDKHIKNELEKAGSAKDGFDLKVIDALKEKAEEKGIKYGE